MKQLNSFHHSFVLSAALALMGPVAFAQGDCNVVVTATITQPSCDAANGAIYANPSGGESPYTFAWSTGATTQGISGIAAGGAYWVDVRDANGCRYKLDVPLECEGGEDNCHFRTQTQGGWGTTANGNNPGVYRDANFAGAFPSGLQIGCTNKLRLTSSAAVRAFLPSGTTARALNAGTLVNPGQGYRNVLAGQLVAATLSVGFDAYDPNFGGSSSSLGSAEILVGPFQGWTVQMLLDEANSFIGGCGSGFSASALNSALTMVNENYVGGTIDLGKLGCEDKKKSAKTSSGSLNLYPNPASDVLTVELIAGSTGNANIRVMDATGRLAMNATRTSLAAGEMRNLTMDISGLPNGSYLVTVEQDGINIVKRMVVAH